MSFPTQKKLFRQREIGLRQLPTSEGYPGWSMPPKDPGGSRRDGEVQSRDVLCGTANEVAEKVEALGLDKGSLEQIALASSPVAATQLAIRFLVQQRGFMDELDAPYKMLVQIGVLRNETNLSEKF